MSSQSLREYIGAVLTRYDKAVCRRAKTEILDEICATSGIHRKHALRLLGQARRGETRASSSPQKRGRKSQYNDPALKICLRRIWKSADFPCGKRLAVMIPDWLDGYEQRYEALTPEIREKASRVSGASIDRLLREARGRLPSHGRSATKPGTLLRDKIPVATSQWEERRLGFVEADTVAHCGETTAGHYVSILVCVDMASTWVETRAVWRKTDTATLKQIRSIERSLPFALRGFDSDNGTEFQNQRVFEYLVGRRKPVVMTRSRPYKKNDNAHVEQKNWTHVRQWIGYERFEHEEVAHALNNLYENEWRLYQNFFNPSVKLIEKRRVGSKTKKKYDTPKTPYQRLLEHPDLREHAKSQLRYIRDNLDPFALKSQINKKLKKIFRLSARLKLKEQREAASVTSNSEATNQKSNILGNLEL